MNRIFLSLPAILFDYQGIQDDFEGIMKGRWIPSQNLHLTLSFFGDRFEKEFLIDTLSSLKLTTQPIELKGMGLFKHNKVLYAKIQAPALQDLHMQVNKTLDISDTQKFVPHVSLMRIKEITDQNLLRTKIQAYDAKAIGELKPTIQLLQSHLAPEGAKYSLLHTFER